MPAAAEEYRVAVQSDRDSCTLPRTIPQVIIISHNKEFCGAVAEEKWIMKGGRLAQEGESKGTGEDEKKGGLDVEKEVSAAPKCRIRSVAASDFRIVYRFWICSIESSVFSECQRVRIL